ncbi:expressed unknown protein [Ectocarpus siliculosus]|uniref:Uncharacterized protein n=1 Tax=Ectocarpus siliculosus TaxID=2880 RepID=D8LMC2_ECTSI|nr:expressed unknown protein [Ectocarpus siliculosus]|eukprot:CBN77532.1 expressed unknown protein [Ectocarpus siliculosus]
MRVAPWLAAVVWSSLFLARLEEVRAQDSEDSSSDSQEEAGDDAQEVTAFAQGGTTNLVDDFAVAGVWIVDTSQLFVAANTGNELSGGTNAGGTDFAIIKYNSDLELQDSVQYGGDGDDTITAMAVDESVQSGIVIVGSTASDEEHLFGLDTAPREQDYFIAELSSGDLEVTKQFVNGSQFNNEELTVVGLEPVLDGAYFAAGWAASADGQDWFALKINHDMDDILWEEPFETTAVSDLPTAMVVSSDAVYVVGYSADFEEDLDDDEVEEVSSLFVYALDVDDGSTLWELTTELGTLADGSQAHGAVLSASETELYIAGHTSGIIPGYDGDTTETDELFVVAIDIAEEAVSWVWQSEANATAFGTAGIVLADDGSPIVGGIAFGDQFNLSSASFTYWEFGSGDFVAAKIDIDDPEDIEVSKYFVAAAASNETREQPFSIVKDTDVADGVFLIGQQDGIFDGEDSEGGDPLNYLVLKVELEVLPEKEDDDDDDGRDFPYWYIGVPLFAGGIALFVVAYKWAAASQAAKAKRATMV